MTLTFDTSEMNVLFVHSALDDYPLTTEEFRVYGHLARRAKHGQAYPGAESMARKCRIHVDTVKAVVRRLEAYGLLRIEQRGERGLPNVYHLTPFSAWKSPEEVLRIQEAAAAAGRVRRAAKRAAKHPHPPGTLPETEGGASNPTPPKRRAGGAGETKGGEGGETNPPEGNPEVIQDKDIQRESARAREDDQAEHSLSLGAGESQEKQGTAGGACGTEAPGGASERPPQPVTVSLQFPASAETHNATSVEKVPGAAVGRAAGGGGPPDPTRTALQVAFGPVFLAQLLSESPTRQGWLGLPAARVAELHQGAIESSGTRPWRTLFISQLDIEVTPKPVNLRLDKPQEEWTPEEWLS